METINQLLSPAFTIAVLGAIESLLSATVADGVTGDKTNSNTELDKRHKEQEYQQKDDSVYYTGNGGAPAVVDIPVPYAAYQARAHVVPRRCIDCRFL